MVRCRGEVPNMMILLVILAVVAAIYIYAVIANYYNFKDWSPMCGRGGACKLPKPSEKSAPADPAR